MNNKLSDKLKTLPRSPGVYFHKSASGEIIYVGKAAVLKNRVRQYFQSNQNMDIKTRSLVAEIADTDWVEVESEIDALFLESEMVKRYMPRYNVLLRDDRSQSFVRIDMKSEWPTVSFTRNPLDDGAEYFGPFYNGYALKKALHYLRRVFPYFIREPKNSDSKLEQQIGLEPRRLDGSAIYKTNLKKLISYIKGNRKAIAKEIEAAMKDAAARHDFEQAMRLRNQLGYLKELQRRVMFGDKEFLDISKDNALRQLADLLKLKNLPRRLEAYDVSHTSGKNVVSSMVVFTNGVSDRAEYRKFKVSETNDDYDNLRQTIARRTSVKNLQQWGTPDLMIIDGGKGQLEAVVSVLENSSVKIPVVSIAKRDDTVIVHNEKSNVDTARLVDLLKQESDVYVKRDGDFFEVNLHPKQFKSSGHSKNIRGAGAVSLYSDLTHLLQRIRDESHRFAISYHTSLGRKSLTKSSLEDIPSIGAVSRRKLLKQFGSLKKIKAASVEDLAIVVGEARAKEIVKWSASIG